MVEIVSQAVRPLLCVGFFDVGLYTMNGRTVCVCVCVCVCARTHLHVLVNFAWIRLCACVCVYMGQSCGIATFPTICLNKQTSNMI